MKRNFAKSKPSGILLPLQLSLFFLFFYQSSAQTTSCIKATCISKTQTSSTLCLRQSDGTATEGGNVQYIYD